MRRIFLIAPVMARIATGMSFGPMHTRATTAITMISGPSKPNKPVSYS
jgi:hypothetical protein